MPTVLILVTTLENGKIVLRYVPRNRQPQN